MKKTTTLLLSFIAISVFLLFLLIQYLNFSPPGARVFPLRGAPQDDVRVDLNLAGYEDLIQLRGIGPVTTDAIISWRDEHGAFHSVEDLLDIPGIGEKTFSGIRDYVIVGGVYENPGSG